MRKVAIIFFLFGIFLFVFGGYQIINKEENSRDSSENKNLVNIPLTDEEKEVVINYLTDKYDEEFSIIEHTSRFCIIDKKDHYEIDNKCNNDDIIDDIYKAENKDGLSFYVKRVTIKDGVDVSYSISKTQSRGLYDNYILFNVIVRLNKEFESYFKSIQKLKSVELTLGLGLEDAMIEKENDKYISYVIYDDLSNEMQNNVDKNISVDEFILKNHIYDTSNEVQLLIKIDDSLSEENIKSYIKLIHDNEYVNLIHGLRANKIIFEFSNELFIKYLDGLNYEILSSGDKKEYDKVITNDFSNFSSNMIYYDDFMNLEEKIFSK